MAHKRKRAHKHGKTIEQRKQGPVKANFMPFELIRLITEYLRNYRRCILKFLSVSRLWYNAALPHLYYRYFIVDLGDLHQLKHLVERDARVASWVRSLHFSALATEEMGVLRFLRDGAEFPSFPLELHKLRVIEFDGLYAYRTTPVLFKTLSQWSSVTIVKFTESLVVPHFFFSMMDGLPNASTIIWNTHDGFSLVLNPGIFIPPRLLPISSLAILARQDETGLPALPCVLPSIIALSSCGLRVLHLDLRKQIEQWTVLPEAFKTLGRTLQELTIRVPANRGYVEKAWLDAQLRSYVDLSLLPKLTSFHFSNLEYVRSALHLIRGLISPHLQYVTLDAAFRFTSDFRPKDYSEHDSGLVSDIHAGLKCVLIRYFGAVARTRVKPRIASVFPLTDERGLLQIVKVSGYMVPWDWGKVQNTYLPS